MLAPFAPHVHKDEGLKASYSNLAARCLLAGKSDAIQVPAKPVNAFIRSDDDDGLIQDGSHVILYSTRDNIETLIIKRNATFDNKHGHFLHNDFIGKPYGSRVYAKKGSKGWLCALRPTSELWTLGCNHRTEILYISDISMILANLGVKPGSIVLETGTGTGSLSTAFISALQPSGRLYTFEYHDERAKGAAVDFDRNGISPWVTVSHRDTIRTGFPDELENQADAVFLDLPAPWDVVAAAKKSLKHGGMFCSFSPCTEQTQATSAKLYELGFSNIETIECLQKAYDVRNIPTQEDFDHWAIDAPGNLFPIDNLKKRNRETSGMPKSDDSSPVDAKKVSTEEIASSAPSTAPIRAFVSKSNRNKPTADPSTFRLTSIPFAEMRGHTGFLIFGRAYKLPRVDSRSATPGPQVTVLPDADAKMDTS